jgi:hypothetical protein
MNDVTTHLANRAQLTSDGNHAYLSAVDEAFDRQIDYAMLIKQYGESPESVWNGQILRSGCKTAASLA